MRYWLKDLTNALLVLAVLVLVYSLFAVVI